MRTNFSIGQRLAVGFGAVMVLTLVIGAYSYYAISKIALENRKQQLIFQTSSAFAAMEFASFEYLSKASESGLDAEQKAYNEGLKNLNDLQPLVTLANQGLITVLRKNFDDFHQSFQEVVNAMKIKKNSLTVIDQMSDKALGIAKKIMGGEVNAGVQQFMGIRLMEKQYMLFANQIGRAHV